jgi:hypothetical protein
MFTGRTIEELIHSVERAEQHAREQGMELEVQEPPARRMEWQEVTEVA